MLDSDAVERFFKKDGFNVDRYNIQSNQIFKQRIDYEVKNKGEIFAFSGSNAHYSGFFLDKASNVWQFDSLKEGPIPSSINGMKCFLDNLGRNNPIARASVIQNKK